MQTALDVLLAFVALYPLVTAALWIAGGLMFRLWEERPSHAVQEPEGGWPGVSILIPAYNEEAVIANSVRAALDSDYPHLEVLVLDDGSTDSTEAVALEAAAGDRRFRVLRDPVNRGKAEQLNVGFASVRHGLVIVTDADTHVHPHAIRYLVSRLESSPLLAAVAAAPHVTNRTGLICAMQVLEAAAIIGLIRRTQSLTGRVGVVAGVLGVFHRDHVLAAGGYDPSASTSGSSASGSRGAWRSRSWRPSSSSSPSRCATPTTTGTCARCSSAPLPVAVPDRLRQRRGRPADHGADPRTAGTAGGVGHPPRTA